MDENGEVTDLSLEAKELLSFLAAIIEAAIIEHERPVTLSEKTYRKIIRGVSCSGKIEVWVMRMIIKLVGNAWNVLMKGLLHIGKVHPGRNGTIRGISQSFQQGI